MARLVRVQLAWRINEDSLIFLTINSCMYVCMCKVYQTRVRLRTHAYLRSWTCMLEQKRCGHVNFYSLCILILLITNKTQSKNLAVHGTCICIACLPQPEWSSLSLWLKYWDLLHLISRSRVGLRFHLLDWGIKCVHCVDHLLLLLPCS